MNKLALIATIFGEIGVIVAAIAPILLHMKKISNGAKCQLRSEMLRIYYHNHAKGEIRQYEYENFVMLYEAYKALKGNSFIDKIYKEVQSWEIIS
jgi:uncharacterized membrane protein